MRIVQDEAAIGPFLGTVVRDARPRAMELPGGGAAEEGRDLLLRRRCPVGRPGAPRRLRQRDAAAPGHRRLVRGAAPGVGQPVARLDVHQDEGIEHHRKPVRLHPGDGLQHRCVRRRPAEDRPAREPAHLPRAAAPLPRHHPGHGLAVLAGLLDGGPDRAAVAAKVIPEPGDDQRDRPRVRKLGRKLVERGDDVRDAAIVVDIEDDVVALAALEVDLLGRQRILAAAGHQRHPAHVERGRARHPRQPLGRPAEDLDVDLRDPVAERREVEVLEHDIGRPAIGGRRALQRLDQRVGQLVLGPPVQAEGDALLLERLPVGPDAPDARDLALAERDGKADRIAVLAHRGAAAALAAHALGMHRLEEPARPDHLPRDPVAAEDPRQRRALARSHHAEALDAPALHRRRAGAEQPLVERLPENGARRLAQRHGADAREGSTDRATQRRARSRQDQRRHHKPLSGKRNTPAIRRAQAGVSGDSTTPCPE